MDLYNSWILGFYVKVKRLHVSKFKDDEFIDDVWKM